MGKTKERMPRPLANNVLIANPANEKLAGDIDAKASKLPPKEKEDFFKKEMAAMWESIEVLAVGPQCSFLTVGDKAIGTPEVVQSVTPTPDSKYLLVRETAFKAIW